MRKQSYAAMVNHIITDPQLYPSTKRVFFAMLCHCSRHNTVRKSVGELAALSGCSPATVQQALEQLQERGIIHKIRCFRYSASFSRPVYARNAYQIKRSKLTGSYTLIPRSLLQLNVTHSAFVAAMYIYMTSGREGRSFASLRTAAKKTYLSKATICRALKALRLAQAFVRYFCIMTNKAHSCNSYYPTDWIRSHARGGLIFNKHHVINKIAEEFYLEGKTYGVCEFGKINKPSASRQASATHPRLPDKYTFAIP